MHLARIEQHSFLAAPAHIVCSNCMYIVQLTLIFAPVYSNLFFLYYVPRCDLISVDWITIVMEIKTFIRKMEKWTKETLYTMYSRGFITLKPNSWTHNHVEVSGHCLRSSQTWGFCMDYLNHGKGVWFSFLLSPLQKQYEVAWVWRNRNLNQSCRGDCEYQGGKLLRLLSGFHLRIQPPIWSLFCSTKR